MHGLEVLHHVASARPGLVVHLLVADPADHFVAAQLDEGPPGHRFVFSRHVVVVVVEQVAQRGGRRDATPGGPTRNTDQDDDDDSLGSDTRHDLGHGRQRHTERQRGPDRARGHAHHQAERRGRRRQGEGGLRERRGR